jgi:hypothetical protein
MLCFFLSRMMPNLSDSPPFVRDQDAHRMPHVLGLTTINTLDNITVLKINLIGFKALTTINTSVATKFLPQSVAERFTPIGPSGA